MDIIGQIPLHDSLLKGYDEGKIERGRSRMEYEYIPKIINNIWINY